MTLDAFARRSMMRLLGRLLLVGLMALGLVEVVSVTSAISQAPNTQCIASASAQGTPDAITIVALPCALTTNLLILTASGANTSTTPTLQPLGLSAQVIVRPDGSALVAGDIPTSGAKALLTPTGSVWVLLNPANVASGSTFVNPIFSGVITGGAKGFWGGDQFFGSGRPWVDVRSGKNGCAAAVGGGGVDDAAAIRCQTAFMLASFGGGVVYFPPGTYTLGSTVTVGGNVVLQGVGANASNIRIASDITAIAFDGSSQFASLDRLEVFGNTSAPTKNLVSVADGALVIFRECVLDGGFWALQTGGVDGDMMNCKVRGWGASGGSVLSSGANTYYDAKLDNAGAVSNLTAFEQVAFYTGGRAENRIVHSDMSGTYTDSLIIADPNAAAITTVESTTFSSPISITGASTTMFIGDEFGSTTLAASGNINISGSAGISVSVGVVGGIQNCSGNSNVNCPTNVAGEQGSTLIAVAAASGSTVGTLGFSSFYNDYEIVADNLVPSVSGVAVELQVHSSGGSFQNSGYLNSTGNITTFVDVLGTSLANLGTTAGQGFSGTIRVHNTNSTSVSKMIMGSGSYSTTSALPAPSTPRGWWNGGQGALDGFQLLPSSGSWTSGTLKVYGLRSAL